MPLKSLILFLVILTSNLIFGKDSLSLQREFSFIEEHAQIHNLTLNPQWKEILRNFKADIILPLYDHPYYRNEEEGGVLYPSDEELADKQIFFIDGLAYGPDHKTFTARNSIYSYEHPFMLALRPDGTCYGREKVRRRWQHSSLCQGKELAYAGLYEFKDGEIVDQTNISGHYQPTWQSRKSLTKKIRLSKDIFLPKEANQAATKIAAAVRGYLFSKKTAQYLQFLPKIRILQKTFRGYKARKYLRDKERAAIQTQKRVRARQARLLFRKKRESTIKIQSWVRGFQARKVLWKIKDLKARRIFLEKKIKRQKFRMIGLVLLDSLGTFFTGSSLPATFLKLGYEQRKLSTREQELLRIERALKNPSNLLKTLTNGGF